jgi:arylsulfatase A-like enzyme
MPSASPPAAPPPNIVLVVLDDLDVNSIRHMPNLRAIFGQQGLTFEAAFSTTPLCAPGRATLLTGQYAHNHGVIQNGGAAGGFEAARAMGLENDTVATRLRAAGYRTVLLGKYLNNYPAGDLGYIPVGWDEWWGVLEDRPADSFDYSVNDNGVIVSYGHRPEDYLTDVMTGEARDFIQRAEADDARPFFMFIGCHPPHAPSTPAPRHENLFAGEIAPRVPSFDEADVRDKPGYVRAIPRLGASGAADLDERQQRRLQSLMSVDEMLSALVATLASTGELDRTFIFFTSDNGQIQGQHRMESKDAPYEESIGVPLLARGPGVPAGVARPHLVGLIDLMPTVLALARAPVPESVDGRSLVPLLGGAPPAPEQWRRDILIEHWFGGSPVAVPEYQGVRTRDHAWVEYATGEQELYDLHADPFQMESAHDSGDPALIQALSARVAALRDCRGATCREP